MIPSNFIPPGPAARLKQQLYTDGTPSREVEDEWEDDSEDMKQFKQGFPYKKNSVLNIRDQLNNLSNLLDVISSSLMAESMYVKPVKVYEAIQLEVLPKIKELEQELARL